MLEKELFVEISENKKYPIFIDFDEIENIGKTLEEKVFKNSNPKKILIVMSEKVEKLYGKKINIKNSIKYVIKDGESQKNFKNYQKILDFAFKNRLERKDTIVAIGGGVTGDIAGLVAATYLRGIDFVQIPTTLLSCVDSSVGGKVAINTHYGKNTVGAFYQPKAVFCNLNFLKTLDERQYKTGLAEIVKYAFISKNCGDVQFFEFLSENTDKILSRGKETLINLVTRSLELKISIVKRDEKEYNLRKILNFGHTYAHAIERITNYKKYTHGESVAIGMVFAINLAFKKGLITNKYKNQSLTLIEKFGLIKKMPKFNRHKLIDLMKADKKVANNKINFILPTKESFVEIVTIEPAELID